MSTIYTPRGLGVAMLFLLAALGVVGCEDTADPPSCTYWRADGIIDTVEYGQPLALGVLMTIAGGSADVTVSTSTDQAPPVRAWRTGQLFAQFVCGQNLWFDLLRTYGDTEFRIEIVELRGADRLSKPNQKEAEAVFSFAFWRALRDYGAGLDPISTDSSISRGASFMLTEHGDVDVARIGIERHPAE